MLNITVPVFDQGRSYGKVKSGKGLEIYFRSRVGTLWLVGIIIVNWQTKIMYQKT